MPENIPVGIVWMLLAAVFFVILDTIAKHLMQSYPVAQVIWARFVFHVFFVLLYMGAKVHTHVVSKNGSLQALRSLAMLITTGLFFFGISRVQLATASTIMFLSPILVTVLAIPMLGESVGLRRWLGVLIGFVGAVIIVRPGSLSMDVGLLYLLAAAFSHSFYQLATRKVRVFDGPMTSLFYTGLVGAIVMSLIAPFFWQAIAPIDWALFVALGFFGAVGHLCFIRGFSVAPAAVISPLSYTTLIWATISGYFFFNDLPDRWVVIGGALIVSSGLYIFYRERQKAGH